MPSKATKKRRVQCRKPSDQSKSPSNNDREDGMLEYLDALSIDDGNEAGENDKMAILPKRPDIGGILGRKEDLITNHVLVNFHPFTIFKYDVQINRDFDCKDATKQSVQKKELKDRGYPIKKREELMFVFYQFVENYPIIFGDLNSAPQRLIYDRVKFLYTYPQLVLNNDQNGRTLEIHGIFTERDELRNESFSYYLTIKLIGQVQVSNFKEAYFANRCNRNRETMQLFDILFRQGFFFEKCGPRTIYIAKDCADFSDSFTVFGRSLYNPNDRIDLGCGRELLRGFYQSPHIVSGWKLTLNVDLVSSAFFKYYQRQPQNAIEFAGDILGFPNAAAVPTQLTVRQTKQLLKEFRGMRFKSTNLGHVFMCNGFGCSAGKYSFPCDEMGGTVLMTDYFQRKYDILLKYPHWPTLAKGPQKRTFYPIELCTLSERQRVPNGKLTELNHTKIIKATAIPPDERMAKTVQVLQQADHNAHSALRNYRISVDSKLMGVEGRILNSPALQYQQTRPVQPRAGVWNMSDVRFLQAMPELQCWAIILVEDSVSYSGFGNRNGARDGFQHRGRNESLSNGDLGKFLDYLIKSANELGMKMRLPVETVCSNEERLENDFDQLILDHPSIQWVMSIVPRKSALVYGKLKLLGEHKYDVAQSNLVLSSVHKVLNNYAKERTLLANFCLKLNTKLGGLNARLTDGPESNKFVAQLLQNQSVIFFGVDVTHPDPGDRKSPSIAAVCSSLDQIPHKYSGVECILDHRVEIMDVQYLAPIIKAQLIAYYMKCRLKPANIVFYRDGVSEGQFNELWLKELAAVQEACRMLEPDYHPKITFIVVQKRHHTRLFKQKVERHWKTTDKNVTAGTVVDTQIVHPNEFDFFLCSHQGIQGTSKPTHYHVLSDDCGYSSDQLQMLTFYLCHAFARCTRSVSLPAPVYYAHLIAYRARVRLQGTGFDGQSASDEPLTDDELKHLSELISVGRSTKNSMYFQ